MSDTLFDITDAPEKPRVSRERKPGELVGTFLGFKQRWPRDDQITETIIGTITEEVADGVLRHTIKGTCTLNSLVAGMTYRFWGRHTTHERFGEQFWFEAFTDETPVSKEAVCLYLQQIDGIGPATAELIWRQYGEESVKIAREEPEAILSAAPRLTIEQCRAGSELLKKKQKSERGKMDLMALVHKCGVPKRIVDKALDYWGVTAAERIRRNPYLLMKFRGIGFLKTDRMWLDFGHNPLRMKRQALACWYSIARDCEGHTWFQQYVARDFLRRHISSANADFATAMELATRSGMLQVREIRGQVFIAEKVRAEQEGRVARLIEEARKESRDQEKQQTIYKTVDRFVGYRIGSDGSVESSWSNGGYTTDTWRPLKPDEIKGGYLRVRLRVANQEHIHVQVSHLVLEAFWGQRPIDYVACHWDGNPKNNCIDNLRWDSRKENEEDKHRIGTHQTGEGNPAAKLTEDQVLKIRELYEQDDITTYRLADQFGVSRPVICKIVKRELWNHI